jgi:CRP/FNR family transcriptional regulator
MTEIDALGPFAAVSEGGRALLRRSVQWKNFAAPTAVIHKGQRVSGAYVVGGGRLRVFTYTPEGTEATLYFLAPGETCVLALNCLFNDLLYPAWVETEAATRVAVIPGTTYRTLFQQEPTIQDLTVRTLSTLVFRLMNEIEQIHSCTLEQRLANFVLQNASAEGLLAMTQQAIASHLGTTREVVARLLGELVDKRCVETGRSRIRIRDAGRLAERARAA